MCPGGGDWSKCCPFVWRITAAAAVVSGDDYVHYRKLFCLIDSDFVAAAADDEAEGDFGGDKDRGTDFPSVYPAQRPVSEQPQLSCSVLTRL